VQESGFAGVVQSKEQELGVFVEQAQRSEDIVDCGSDNVKDVFRRNKQERWTWMGGFRHIGRL
jgi:hypothetical protein